MKFLSILLLLALVGCSTASYEFKDPGTACSKTNKLANENDVVCIPVDGYSDDTIMHTMMPWELDRMKSRD